MPVRPTPRVRARKPRTEPRTVVTVRASFSFDSSISRLEQQGGAMGGGFRPQGGGADARPLCIPEVARNSEKLELICKIFAQCWPKVTYVLRTRQRLGNK